MGIYKLKDMINVISGNPKYTKKYIQNNKGIYPVISSSAFNNGIYGYINTFDYEKGTTISKDGSIGNVFFQNSKFSLYGAFLIKPNEDKILEKYLFYFLKSKEFYLKSIGVGSVIKHIYRYHIDNIKINLPSHETQRSIIEIIKQKEKLFLNFSELVRLDSLENTQNDMKALIEIIEPLKKQIDLVNLKLYLFKKYCQNKIKIIFDQNSFFKKYNLQDLFNISRGKIINSKYLNDNKGEYPVISSNTKNNGIFGYINTYMYNGEYITVSADGAYAGTIFYQNGKFSITNVCFILKPKVKKLFYLKFVFAYLKSIEQNIKKDCSVGSSRPAVREYSLKNVKINLPSLEIQQSLIHIIEPLYKKIELLEQKKILLEKRFNFYINFLIKKGKQ